MNDENQFQCEFEMNLQLVSLIKRSVCLTNALWLRKKQITAEIELKFFTT